MSAGEMIKQDLHDSQRVAPRLIRVLTPARYAVHPFILVFALMFGIAGLVRSSGSKSGGFAHKITILIA